MSHRESCVFLNEESEECRYGDICERNLYMYQHKFSEKKKVKEPIDIIEDDCDENCYKNGDNGRDNDDEE
jgi:hypothetical protein